jgi:hypothetical protein
MDSSAVISLSSSKAFPSAVKFLARSFIESHAASPRDSAFFATQQRWLLCNLGLAFYYRDGGVEKGGASRQALLRLALANRICSRNTFNAIYNETLHYDLVRVVDAPVNDWFEPSPSSIAHVVGYYRMHLQAIDSLDQGVRTATFMANAEGALARLHPLFVDRLLADSVVRAPEPYYSVFASIDAGGWLMDRLIDGVVDDIRITPDRLLTTITSISGLANDVGLSRAHTSRTLAMAEKQGGLGWTGRRGWSAIWISQAFFDEYARAQARKLVIFDKLSTLLPVGPASG